MFPPIWSIYKSETSIGSTKFKSLGYGSFILHVPQFVDMRLNSQCATTTINHQAI
uniref:Uncharacterized protein n=1 Tax=Rhizophora mucronata TaxID=61149 RepID=A0A2P2PVZ4_RHIMU